MDNKQKNEIKVSFFYTDEDIEDIIITALEGGIGYWACLDNSGDDFKAKPKGMSTSEWCWHLLKEGKELRFLDAEDPDDAEYHLCLPCLLDGIGKAVCHGHWDGDMNSLDAESADAIIQYAIFDDIIYG